MPKRVTEVGEGHEDASSNGVYYFIRDLIEEGKDARFVDKKGRYVINWSRALKCYHDYKSKRNPQYKSKNIKRRKASNGLRSALLNFYKKEGAKEYKDSKKVNDENEVIERQFQMPPKVFKSLFGSDLQLLDDGSEHETSSITSEADEKPQVTPNSSDTAFDEAIDISDGEDPVDASDITTPCQIFNISKEELDSALEEICSSSENDVDLLGVAVVQDICPSSGSVKGGLQFHITLTEELSEDDKSGIAYFHGIGDVYLEKLNPFTFDGIIPASQQPGPVPVTVYTQARQLLGMTYFTYVDEIQEALKQLVKDPALQSLYFAMWSQEYGIFGSDSNIAQNLGSFNLQDQGSIIQAKHTQAVKVLQILVYTAAQTDAQQFIQMIFSTSAGKKVFDAYRDRTPLPEDVARANGHDDLAQYLQDVNKRLFKESRSDAQFNTIDWSELVDAVSKIQKQSSVTEDETDVDRRQSKDDDNQSDYFADAETSSCGSFEREVGWSDSEDDEGTCTKDAGSKKESCVKSTSSFEDTLVKTRLEEEVPLVEKEKFDVSSAEPSVPLSKGNDFLGRLNRWRKGDGTTARQQGVCVDKVPEVITEGTHPSDDPIARQQEANASPTHEKGAKPQKQERPTATTGSSTWFYDISWIWCFVITILIVFIGVAVFIGLVFFIAVAVCNMNKRLRQDVKPQNKCRYKNITDLREAVPTVILLRYKELLECWKKLGLNLDIQDWELECFDLRKTVLTDTLLREMCKYIDMRKIGGAWKELGAELGIKVGEIDELNASDKNKTIAVILSWIQQEGTPATAETLVDALKRIGQSKIAEKTT